jgi:dienelactone hydrolase
VSSVREIDEERSRLHDNTQTSCGATSRSQKLLWLAKPFTNYAGEMPSASVMLHFGKQDAHIPAEVKKVHAAHPEVEIHWYDAGHGFNCDARGSVR